MTLRQLAEDFLSAILFWIVYSLSGSLYAGVGIGVAVGLGQIARLTLRHKPVEPVQWISLGLVVVLGTATILTASPRLMMLKPSIVHLAIAGVMLRRGWMNRYLSPAVRTHVPERAIVAAGYAWAALLAAMAAANLVVALNFDIATWGWFVSVGLLGAKAAAFGVQYLVFRELVRRDLRRTGAIPIAAAAGAVTE